MPAALAGERRCALVQIARTARIPPVLALTMLGAMVDACGRPSGASGGCDTGFSGEPAAQTVTVRAHPHGDPARAPAEYAAKAGDVTFVVVNPSTLSHDVAVEGPGVRAQSAPFGGGTTQRYTLKGLQPGTYQIVCTVPATARPG